MFKKSSALELILLVFIISNLVIVIGNLIILQERAKQFERKVIISGEIIGIEYYNASYPVNFVFLPNETVTESYKYFNLTINDQLSNSIKCFSLDISIVIEYNVTIGDVISIYNKSPFIEITKGGD